MQLILFIIILKTTMSKELGAYDCLSRLLKLMIEIEIVKLK